MPHDLDMRREPTNSTPLPAVTFATDDKAALGKQVESITTNVVTAVREVIKVAQDLEAMVLQNAARVKVELEEHIALAGAVKTEASRLGGIISKLRTTQAELIAERKTNGNGQPH